jgi:guanylate kinase
MAHAGEFKYAIINKDFNSARQELAKIVRRERRPH